MRAIHFLLTVGCLIAPVSAKDDEPLNVLFIMADDLGVMDISPYNPDTFYDTPALASLSDSGLKFTSGYASCPVCSPTRSSVMTGQWPARTRNTDYFGAPNEFLGESLADDYDPVKDGKMKRFKKRPLWPAPYLGELAASHTTIAEAFKAEGYATFFAGKWHLGPKGSWPTDHGFDINKGGHRGGGPYGGKKYFSPYDNPTMENGPDGEHLPDRLATETANFIGKNKDQPFFAMLSFYSVHTPLMGRPDLVEKYQKRRRERGLTDAFEPEWPRKNRAVQSHAIYGAMVEAMDQAVGKVLASLEEHGVADRTIVVFTSDHGGLSTSEGSPTTNLPYRAGKGWMYEGGVRVAALARWPGVTEPGSESDWRMTSTDFFPTLLEATGLDPLPEQHVDGVSFVPAMRDPSVKNVDRPLFWHYPHWGNQGGIPGAAVRQGDWKLIEYFWHKPLELFDLSKDPGERHNVADKHPEVVAKLKRQLRSFQDETDALMPAKNPDPKKPFNKW